MVLLAFVYESDLGGFRYRQSVFSENFFAIPTGGNFVTVKDFFLSAGNKFRRALNSYTYYTLLGALVNPGLTAGDNL